MRTFASTADAEPTNNDPERAVRQAVSWRNISSGADTEGSRFVERVPTMVASCGQRGRNVLEFLIDGIQAAKIVNPTPPPLPARA